MFRIVWVDILIPVDSRKPLLVWVFSRSHELCYGQFLTCHGEKIYFSHPPPATADICERFTYVTEGGFGTLNLICGFAARFSLLEKPYNLLSGTSAQLLHGVTETIHNMSNLFLTIKK